MYTNFASYFEMAAHQPVHQKVMKSSLHIYVQAQ
jgi:hypothetical protein